MKFWLVLLLASACMGFSPFRLQTEVLKTTPVTCSKYLCHPSTMNFTAGTCVYTVNDTNYLQQCTGLGANTYCSLNTTSQNSTCVVPPKLPPTTLSSYPGERCNNNTDCVYGNCLNGLCKGVNTTGQCLNHLQCGPSLRCFNSTCQSLLSVGSTGCMTDFDCVPSAGCNITSETGFGVCVPYLSIPNGASTGSDCQANPDFAIICASGWCQKSSWLSKNGVCVPAPSSVQGTPTVCNQTSDCVGAAPGATYLGQCTCGFNPTGTAYCEPFPGDIVGLSVLNRIGTLVNSGVLNYCNTARRFAAGCWNTYNSNFIAALYTAIAYYNYFPLLQNNDACTQVIYLNYYYHIGWAEGLVLTGLMMLLLA